MEIIKAELGMLPEIEEIYAGARRFMRETGNLEQWGNSYPGREILEEDIADSRLYSCVDEGKVIAVFYYKFGEDPTYREIFSGAWKNDLPYAVIHRVAVGDSARGKGVIGAIFDFASQKCPNLKIDTHKDNIPMQKALAKHGFEYCGIIKLANGDPRLAFQRTR